MIQRIQSVFLLLAALMMGLTAFLPLLDLSFLVSSGSEVAQSKYLTLYSYGIGEFAGEFPTWGILTFAILSGLLSLISIFLYKNRKSQLNFCYLTALSIVLYYVTSMVYLNSYVSKIPAEYTFNIQIGIILPVVALIFVLIAISRIKKDEKLVRSLDRIR